MKRTSLSPLFCLYLKAGRIKNAYRVSSLTLKRKFVSDKKGHICKTGRYTALTITWFQTVHHFELGPEILKCTDSDICQNSITFLRFVKTCPHSSWSLWSPVNTSKKCVSSKFNVLIWNTFFSEETHFLSPVEKEKCLNSKLWNWRLNKNMFEI